MWRVVLIWILTTGMLGAMTPLKPVGKPREGQNLVSQVQRVSPGPLQPGVHRDTTYLSEDFEDDGFPPAGWYSEVLAGSYDWEKAAGTGHPSGYAPYSGDSLALYRSFDASAGSEARLISDTLDLSTAGQPKLTFAMFHDDAYGSLDDSLVVEVRVRSGGSWPSSWDRLAAFHRYSASGDAWALHEVDLSSHAGDTLLLGFHAYSAYGNDLHLDYIQVVDAPTADVGVKELDTVLAYPLVTQDPDDWKVWVHNYGSETQRNFWVYMGTTGKGTVDSVWVDSLAAGDSLLATFTWTPTSSGFQDFWFFTILSGDQQSRNDTLFLNGVVFGRAPTSIFSESFESPTFPPPNWSVWDRDGNDTTWHRTDAEAYEGFYSARTPVLASGNYPNNSDDRLYTPLTDFGSHTNGVLIYAFQHQLEEGFDSVSVYVLSYTSVDDPNPLVQHARSHTGYATTWSKDTLALTGLNRFNVILWWFHSDASVTREGFYLDEVIFGAQDQHDVGVDSIAAPGDTVLLGSSRHPAAWIQNYGDYTDTLMAFFYIHSGPDTVFADTFQVLGLPPGADTLVTFKAWTVPGQNGHRYDMTATVWSPDDANSGNNERTGETTVYAHSGADPYGWTWLDAHSSNGPTYNWIELYNNRAGADSVKTLALGDDGEAWLSLAHPLIVYGDTFDSLCVGANGGFDFMSSQINYYNTSLPTTSQKKFFAVFWEDLRASSNPQAGDSLVYAGYFGDTLLVLEWYRIPRINYGDPLTFEALIYTHPGGESPIVFQYKDLSAYDTIGYNATIGIQDTAGSGNAVLYTYDEIPYTPNWSETRAGFAIQFNNPDGVPTAVAEDGTRRFQLLVSPTVTRGPVRLLYALPAPRILRVKVYDPSGREVRTLLHTRQGPGTYTLTWDGRDAWGTPVASSVYFLRFEVGQRVYLKKVLLLR